MARSTPRITLSWATMAASCIAGVALASESRWARTAGSIGSAFIAIESPAIRVPVAGIFSAAGVGRSQAARQRASSDARTSIRCLRTTGSRDLPSIRPAGRGSGSSR